ncbi:VOC family protein [Pseudonocardia parietis]|uniref:Enzyme related to lactoylglutathione lyase n=1 Tax=Pseudonocardia parietis TaxID=570936 RepID=A0ABS4W5P0_9PSEU|nr:VOC family protein [Pseudonocardia parietis]MBP2370929.1 putative enzyme related to lactoylglutathione lyase [Pseudonocardia parietis]
MITASPAGRFCWFDLKTRDVHGTSAFLAATLGWESALPDPLRATHLLVLDGARIGSLSDLSGPAYPPGLPDHVALYLGVDDVEKQTDTVRALGATVVIEPFELPGVGRTAFIVDPLGAGVALWESLGFAGWDPARDDSRPAPTSPAHASSDPHAAADFYRHLGLNPGAARFTRDDDRNEWQLRVTGMHAAVTTPGGVVLHPGGGGARVRTATT